jgi:hypothetical protein
MGELADTLRMLERRFAPDMVTARREVSRLDVGKHFPTNRGGDKMHPKGNNYGPAFAELLQGMQPETVVELGVLTGASLAMWCELYPEAQVVGLDVDLSRVEWDDLVSRGAFKLNRPLMFEWDAFAPEPIPEVSGIDVFIDDGPHKVEAIRRVAEFVKPLMNPGGRYIVEDVPEAFEVLQQVWPDNQVKRWGRLSGVFL